MGIRVEVAEGELIGQALRRLKKKTQRDGLDYWMRRIAYFLKATPIRRRKRYKKRLLARQRSLDELIMSGPSLASRNEACEKFNRRQGKP